MNSKLYLTFEYVGGDKVYTCFIVTDEGLCVDLERCH
jgi:hypothetical protein